jgi:hypothetical protein
VSDAATAMRLLAGDPQKYRQLSAGARRAFVDRQTQFLSLSWLQNFMTKAYTETIRGDFSATLPRNSPVSSR